MLREPFNKESRIVAKESASVPLRVQMISSWFHPVVGGAEKQAQLLSKTLTEMGVPVCMMTSWVKGELGFEIVDGVPVHRVGTNNTLHSHLARYWQWVWFLYSARHSYDVIHVHEPFSAAFIACFIGRLLKKKVIVKIPSGGLGGSADLLAQSWRGRLAMPVFRRFVHAFITLNEEIRREYIGFGVVPSRLIMMPNCVDTSLFAPPTLNERRALKEHLWGGEFPVVVTVGRLIRDLGTELLVQAWSLVTRVIPEATLIIVGSGEEEGHLKQLAKDLGVERAVQFLGMRTNVSDILKASDLFVQPSIREGMSNALLEAMSTGLPVIASAVGGSLEMIEDGVSGVLFDRRDPARLAQLILDVLHNQSKATGLGQSARTSIVKKYSKHTIAQQYLALYQKLVNR